MVLVDTLYLNSAGGKTLLNIFLKKLKQNHIKFILFVDKRNNFFEGKSNDYIIHTKASLCNRKKIYEKYYPKVNIIICLSNIPPPFHINIPVHIYFHNDLLIDTSGSSLNVNQISLLLLKRLYIKLLNRRSYKWHVQTLLIKKKLNKSINIPFDNINVTPFFQKLKPRQLKSISASSFIYVAAYSPHKNHKNLIKGFIQAAHSTKKTLKLSFTLDSETTQTVLSNFQVPDNLIIKALGILSKDILIENYCKNKFLIYPSLKESLGLPLIEAAQLGLKVIAADLPYTHEVIEPSLTFDPLSASSICDVILNALNLNEIKSTKIKIESKIETLIENLS